MRPPTHHIAPKKFDADRATERLRQVGLTLAGRPELLYLSYDPDDDRSIAERFFAITTKFKIDTSPSPSGRRR